MIATPRAAKASTFTFANPDCVRRLQWQFWPDTKPTGAPEPTLIAWDANYLRTQMDTMEAALKKNGCEVQRREFPWRTHETVLFDVPRLAADRATVDYIAEFVTRHTKR